MIPEADARQLMRRLSGLPYVTQLSADAAAELLAALRNAPANFAHAGRIVEHIHQHITDTPLPAHVWQAATATAAEAETPDYTAPAKCPRCHGVGYLIGYWLRTVERRGGGVFHSDAPIAWEVYERLRSQVDGVDQIVFDGAVACDCRKVRAS